MPIHPSAIIDPRADIDPSVEVGPHVVVEGPVRVGPGCRIGPFSVLLGHTEIGPDCRIHAHVVIGDLPQDRAYQGQESYCRIGAGCVIREGVTVHRGTAQGSSTEIGARCFLMTNAHVGHNCVIGDDVTLVSGCLLGGHVQVGDRAVISGNTAVHQFVRIGELAMVSGMGKIVLDVPPFLMTDRDGGIVGINRLGMLRAEISAAERQDVKTVYKAFYRTGLAPAEAIALLGDTITGGAGRRLLDFLAARSLRGIRRGARRRAVPVAESPDKE